MAKKLYDYEKFKQRKLYYILTPLGKAVSKFMFKVTYIGKENIPENTNRGLIVASNHISQKDPIIVAMGCKKPCHFLAKEELFEKSLPRWFLTNINAFPINRGRGDMASLEFSIKIVEKGWDLGIFPEGTRSPDGTPQAGKSGVGLIAKKTGADVLPVSIYKDQKTKKITVRYGKVIKNEEFGFTEDGKSKEIKNAAAIIMNRITEMWEEGSCK